MSPCNYPGTFFVKPKCRYHPETGRADIRSDLGRSGARILKGTAAPLVLRKGGRVYFDFIFETAMRQNEFPRVFIENANDEIPLLLYRQTMSDLPDIIAVADISLGMNGPEVC